MFEDRKSRRGDTRAAMSPLAPAETGQAVEFRAEGSRPGAGAETLTCYWTFGDGGFAIGPVVKHVFARPGMYPVTLTVDDGMARASHTQHIAVGGEPVSEAVLALAAPDEPSLRPRPARVTDTYGAPIRDLPHTLRFVARPSRPRPRPRWVEARNLGGRTTVRMRPNRSRRIGQFPFAAGTDGHVEILAPGSQGLVMADAVVFEPVE